MNTKKSEELIDRFQKGTLSPDEEAMLDGWYLGWRKDDLVDISDEALQGRKLAVWNKLDSSRHKRSQIKLWPRIAAISSARKVAAAVAVMTLGVWLYYASGLADGLFGGRHLEGSAATRDLSINDIAPGRNTATITFDNGEAVDLNDKELSISSESVEPLKEGSEASSETTQFLASRISRSKTVVLSTPRGGTYQVTLPDGTRVWLNADTKIEFPSKFSSAQRKVLLTSGEAYFEVSKNKAKPFVVESRGQRVEVLGTHFNINSYADEGGTKTTLLEGSVSVSSLRGLGGASRGNLPGRDPSTTRRAATTILLPNQQATLSASAQISVKQINPAEVTAWKNAEFRFEGEDFQTAMRKIARWYDVEMVYENGLPENFELGGVVSRNKKLSEVLHLIEKTGGVKFKIEGRKVLIRK